VRSKIPGWFPSPCFLILPGPEVPTLYSVLILFIHISVPHDAP
jgi:hypothetical protein